MTLWLLVRMLGSFSCPPVINGGGKREKNALFSPLPPHLGK